MTAIRHIKKSKWRRLARTEEDGGEAERNEREPEQTWQQRRKGCERMGRSKLTREKTGDLNCFPLLKPVGYEGVRHTCMHARTHRPASGEECAGLWPCSLPPLTSVWTQLICFDRCVKYFISCKGSEWAEDIQRGPSLGSSEDLGLPDASPAKMSKLYTSSQRLQSRGKDTMLLNLNAGGLVRRL